MQPFFSFASNALTVFNQVCSKGTDSPLTICGPIQSCQWGSPLATCLCCAQKQLSSSAHLGKVGHGGMKSQTKRFISSTGGGVGCSLRCRHKQCNCTVCQVSIVISVWVWFTAHSFPAIFIHVASHLHCLSCSCDHHGLRMKWLYESEMNQVHSGLQWFRSVSRVTHRIFCVCLMCFLVCVYYHAVRQETRCRKVCNSSPSAF